MYGELTRKQFDILEVLANSKSSLSQRDIEKATCYSLGTVNSTVKELAELGYIDEGYITNVGMRC